MTENNMDPKGFTAKLNALLKEAQAAAGQNDADLRRDVSVKLTNFIVESNPDNDCIRALDDIAGNAATSLLNMNIEGSLRELAACNVQLAKATKQFSTAATSAAHTAQSMQLAKFAGVLDALNEGVESIRELQDDLKGGSDQALLDSLMKAEAAMVAARESVRLRDA